jgi:hypothetical protein
MKNIHPTNETTFIQHYKTFIYSTLVVQGTERPWKSEIISKNIMKACQRMTKNEVDKIEPNVDLLTSYFLSTFYSSTH